MPDGARRLLAGVLATMSLRGNTRRPVTPCEIGDDGRARCPWGASTAEYRAYHDEEWGRPVGDDQRVFEKLCLEGFQAGLSWLTILRKRGGLRRAFAAFDARKVSCFDNADIERLLGDSAIVRHRAKIVATINNARAVIALADEGVSIAALLWRYEPARKVPRRTMGDVPASTAESAALSLELRRRGFSFVGPITVYSAMQALGVVNDHLSACHWHQLADSDRALFQVPCALEAR
ncbi:MAG: DNA-3-methyladenine glycosylase I [Acidimicrobiales bacterium]